MKKMLSLKMSLRFLEKRIIRKKLKIIKIMRIIRKIMEVVK